MSFPLMAVSSSTRCHISDGLLEMMLTSLPSNGLHSHLSSSVQESNSEGKRGSDPILDNKDHKVSDQCSYSSKWIEGGAGETQLAPPAIYATKMLHF